MSLLSIILPWLWSGLIIGVSFIATPVKFRAETLEIGAALDVGRHTFNLFNKVEWGVLIFMIILIAIKPLSSLQIGLIILVSAILLAQTFWLLPELVIRAEAVIMGEPKPSSMHHTIYAGLEAAKLIIVSYLGYHALSLYAVK